MVCSIPIYWGASDIISGPYGINPKRIIHARDFPDYAALWKRVQEIDSNDQLFLQMINEPFFLNNRHPEYMAHRVCWREETDKGEHSDINLLQYSHSFFSLLYAPGLYS